MAAVSHPSSSQAPDYPYSWSPTPPPGSQVPVSTTKRSGGSSSLSPPLVAMIAVVGTAFLIVLYARLLSRPLRRMRSRWRRRRRRMALSAADLDGASPPRNPGWVEDYAYYYYYNSSGGSSNHLLYSPYGLDEAAIKALPVSMFTADTSKGDGGKKQHQRECAVCLLEFEDGDWVRTLPLCSHAFHADCIDVWLRSHANCPLCRAAIFQGQQVDGGGWSSAAPTFAPMRAARIRPSFDEILLLPTNAAHHPPLPERQAAAIIPESPDRGSRQAEEEEEEIVAASPPRRNGGGEYEERRGGGNLLLLSRSYSFGFERNLGGGCDHRMGSSLAATTPWRYPRGGGSRSKRWPSPYAGGLGSTSAPRPSAGGGPRVFSFRSYLGVGSYLRSSPLFHRGRRSGSSFLPLSESRAGVGSHNNPSRRTRSMTMLSSPAFFPHAGGSSRGGWGWGGPAASSSRHRCGDPEALLSPDRLNSSSGNGR